jgi:DNA-binding NtrC family response regulator
MPVHIVVVHDDPQSIEMSVAAFGGAGHDVRAFSSSMAAIDALNTPEPVELLVTRVVFPDGQPHGVSLARIKRPGVKILFVARPRTESTRKGLAIS